MFIQNQTFIQKSITGILRKINWKLITKDILNLNSPFEKFSSVIVLVLQKDGNNRFLNETAMQLKTYFASLASIGSIMVSRSVVSADLAWGQDGLVFVTLGEALTSVW